MRVGTHFIGERLMYRLYRPVLVGILSLAATCPEPAIALETSQGSPAEFTQGGPQVTEGYVNAPISTVWDIFTTSEGLKATGVALAEVDLRVGGTIRSQANGAGRLGDDETIVSEILAYEPERMLALRVRKAPASFPFKEAVSRIWTVIYFTPAGAQMTHVRIVGLGYGDDEASLQLRRFFEAGNRRTLDHVSRPYWPKCALCEKQAQPTAN